MAPSSPSAERRFDAIIFDLFGTLVFVEPERLPRELIGGEERVVTIDGLDELLDELEPRVAKEDFLRAGLAVSVALQTEKEATNVEVSSHLRFLRALNELGVSGDLERVARTMSERHMDSLSGCVTCPADRRDLLVALGAHYRLALVSNFDHGATAHAILARNGLDVLFEHVVISDDVGICKPSPQIFLSVCEQLGVEPARTVHVGDSMRADVGGAVGAGLHAVWIGDANEEAGGALGTVGDVSELPAWLGR